VNKNKKYTTCVKSYYLVLRFNCCRLAGCESSLRKQPDQPYTIANASYDIALLSAEKSLGLKMYMKSKKLRQSLRKEFKNFILKMRS